MNQSSQKLDYKMLGQLIKIHNVFHHYLLWKLFTNLLTNWLNELPPLVIINNKKKCKVEKNIDVRDKRDKLQYQVKWVSWDENRKWYNTTRLENSLEIMEDCHSWHPIKPRSGEPVARKSKRKRGWKFGISLYYLLEELRILIKGWCWDSVVYVIILDHVSAWLSRTRGPGYKVMWLFYQRIFVSGNYIFYTQYIQFSFIILFSLF